MNGEYNKIPLTAVAVYLLRKGQNRRDREIRDDIDSGPVRPRAPFPRRSAGREGEREDQNSTALS
jgi:hypothetical protein